MSIFWWKASLQRLGPQVRAQVQLIETMDGFQVWSQDFDADDDEDVVGSLLASILPRIETQLVAFLYFISFGMRAAN